LLKIASEKSVKPKSIPMKKIVQTDTAPAPIGPYNQAVIVGDSVYISGTIAMDLQSKQLIKTNIKEETKIVMEYIGAILKAAGLGYDNVVKTTIFLNDMNNFVHVNEVYSSFFKKDFPARATIQAQRLPKDANVEISCEAKIF
jgi:2-iminobutanoate/2-iminopropanoate deaminase